MARGDVKGPLGPLMLALLVGVSVFMLYAANNPEMDGWFDRPEGFYDNTFEKVGYAILFAVVVSSIIAIFRRRP